jgi:hypothetical protein
MTKLLILTIMKASNNLEKYHHIFTANNSQTIIHNIIRGEAIRVFIKPSYRQVNCQESVLNCSMIYKCPNFNNPLGFYPHVYSM